MKELPEKYYLTHFLEFKHFITSTSAHLLCEEASHFFNAFEALTEDAQCVLVRIMNRKSAFIKKSTLHYDEIQDTPTALNELRKAKFVSRISKHDYPQLTLELSKPELTELADHSEQSKPTKSANKAKWVNFVANQLNTDLAYEQVKKHSVLTSYIYFSQQSTFQYLLFLYFGHLGGRLNQFSMRDLGVMKTQSVSQQQANFSSLEEAKSAFVHASQFNQLKDVSKAEPDIIRQLAQVQLDLPSPEGFLAKQKYHHGLYKLGHVLAAVDLQQSERLLGLSEHPAAKEQYIRLLYKKGQQAECKQLLLEIIEDPQSEALLLFAEDFYALKFDKKQTSILTDILRQSPPALAIDEAYLGYVESGVKDAYVKRGRQCYFTENKLWRALFTLTFWQELYQHPDSQRANEFSYTPKVLKEQAFYRNFESQITQKLAQFNTSDTLLTHIKHTFTAHQGEPNGLFFWHTQLLEVLTCFITHSPINAITDFLLSMAKHFESLSDGFPDLMIIEDGQVFFEEIKAPGDSLRRNQLITIKHLIKAGFNVSIQRVEWQFDSNQNYVVVDIETTGGKKEHHRITEVGMVRIENGQIVDTWQTLVNPERRIPKMITELTGIDNDMVKDAPVFALVADKIDAFSQNAIFVAHNVNFDFGFIKQEFARLEKRFARAKICTVQQARKYLPGYRSYSLGKLCHELDIPLENHHRALDDAQAAAQILLRVNQARVKQQAEQD